MAGGGRVRRFWNTRTNHGRAQERRVCVISLMKPPDYDLLPTRKGAPSGVASKKLFLSLLLVRCRGSIIGPGRQKCILHTSLRHYKKMHFRLLKESKLSSELLLVFEDSDDRRPQCAAHHGVNHGEGLCCLLPSVLRVHQKLCLGLLQRVESASRRGHKRAE